jgi:DNA-binding MarR family transcriptional regulator
VLAKSADPLTLGDLADRLTCVRSNITQLIDRLEAGGLVKRVEDASDRRSVRAAITPLGRELQREGKEQMDHVLASFRGPAGIGSLLEKARRFRG